MRNSKVFLPVKLARVHTLCFLGPVATSGFPYGLHDSKRAKVLTTASKALC